MYPYYKCFNHSLPKTLKNCVNQETFSHTHNARWSYSGCFKIPSHNSKLYERHWSNIMVIYTWKYLQKLHLNILFYQLPLTKLKSLIKNTIHLVITNGLISCIMHFCAFDCFITKSILLFQFYLVLRVMFKVIRPDLTLLLDIALWLSK